MQVGVDHPSPGKPIATPSDRIAHQCMVFLQEVLGSVHPRDFSFRLWDGSVWNAEPGEPSRFTMVLRNPGVLRTMFWSPSELALGEAYLYNDLDIEGDIGSAFLLADRLVHLRLGLAERLRFARLLLALPSSSRHWGARPAERIARPPPLDRAGPAGRHLSLRYVQCILFPVVGRADGVLLRVFHGSRRQSGHGPGTETGLPLSEAAAAARRTRARHRMWMGRTGHPRGEELRRPGARDHVE